MNAEQEAVKRILERFPVLENRLHITGKQRLSIDPLVRRDFEKVFSFLVVDAGFDRFHQVFGVDDEDSLVAFYVLSNADHVMLSLIQKVPKVRPVIHSVSSIFPGALLQEKELVDLFGFVVESLPEGPRFPLPHRWPEQCWPLRKNWNVADFDPENFDYTPSSSHPADEY